MNTKTAVLGWSRTKVRLPAEAIVLDVGSGAWPNPAATIACDRSLDEDIHRTGLATKVDRPFVICDASALPFRDGSIDFVIASHIAEHVDDPAGFCAELARAARAGYIETPSPLADYLLDEEYHQWRVGGRGSRIRFARKPAKGAVTKALTDRFYRAFYAGRTTGASTYPLRGPIGAVIAKMLFVIRGVLNRTGVMHTSISFSPQSPLACTVDESFDTPGTARRVAIIERGPRSGFIEGDRRVIERTAQTRIVRYPGWPSPRFMVATWRAAGWSDAVYTFFASEQALVGAVIARLRRRRFVVCVGGYDVANVREHGYGLATRWPHRLVPQVVLALSDRVIAMSESARSEALAAGAPPDRTSVVYIGLEPRFEDPPPDVVRDPHQVITVAYVDEVSWSRKGIDRFVAAARRDPARRYVLVGRIADDLHTDALCDPPANLVLAGYVDDDGLRDLLWSSGVYAQFSWHEGFGVSMVEAMQAGCRPVVTEVSALREIAGPDAVVSQDRGDDVEAIARAVMLDVDRTKFASWARSVACMENRASGLEHALFGAD